MSVSGIRRRKLLFTNANIVTMDPLRPRAEWLAVDGGEIMCLGSNGDYELPFGGDFEIIDCDGKTIVPGFVDAHCHLHGFVESLATLDLRPCEQISSIDDIKKAIREISRKIPSGAWIRGRGYNEFHLAEARHPNRWDLDEVAPDRPVKLTHRSGHAHVLNSTALRLAGISSATPEPAGGLIERDARSAEPTGVLYEMGEYLADRIPAPDSRQSRAEVKLAEERLLAMGITTVHDASHTNSVNRWKKFLSWKQRGIFRPTVRMMIAPRYMEAREFSESGRNPRENDPRVTAVKIILDETAGALHPSQRELNAIVSAAHRRNLSVAIHAVERSAIESACDAIEKADKQFPGSSGRDRIEHCSVCDPSLARRIASLGITVVTQPAFLHFHGDRYLDTVPPNDLFDLYPLKTLIENGVNVAASSDFPMDPPNPLLGIHAAVTRRARTGTAVSEAQAVSPSEALQMYTRDAAKAVGDDGARGTITPGMAADLAVLSGDPTKVPCDRIMDIRVKMTILGGEIAWESKD